MGQKISMVQAAEEYGVSQSTIRRYIAEGRLAAYRVGPRMIHLDADQLDAELCGQHLRHGISPSHTGLVGNPRRGIPIGPNHHNVGLPCQAILNDPHHSVGELIPLFKGNSDSADQYIDIMGRTVRPLAIRGACAILLDHLAKSHDNRAYGAGGTMAKGAVQKHICSAVRWGYPRC